MTKPALPQQISDAWVYTKSLALQRNPAPQPWEGGHPFLGPGAGTSKLGAFAHKGRKSKGGAIRFLGGWLSTSKLAPDLPTTIFGNAKNSVAQRVWSVKTQGGQRFSGRNGGLWRGC
jgi:hypothetical protein